MNRLKIVMALAVLCALPLKHVSAQEYRPCGIYEAEQLQKQRHPGIETVRQQLEAFTRSYTQNHSPQKNPSGVISYTIPVVFHIMHNYGNENVSKAQVLDAVRLINEDYQKRNLDTSEIATFFKPIVADCQIEFKLAQLDPSGNCTDGITRHQTDLTAIADDNVKYIVDWPSDRYLNIWVVKNISFGAAGYAYYPGIGPVEDGIVIRADYIGSIGLANGSNYSRHSLSHEIGHYFNLRHTWGNSNTPGDPANCNDDDLVFDTPNTVGVSNFSCDTNQITCTAGVRDNVQNYMDYAGCHNMFTDGQKTRMYAALNSSAGSRNNLWLQSNLSLTGTNASFVPSACNATPDFNPSRIYLCEGTTYTFKDLTWNTPSAYTRLWQFPGGSPSTSSDSLPAVTYSSSGIYDVSLTVTTAAGSQTLTRSQYVTITPQTGTAVAPISEGFETLSLPGANYWSIENEAGPAWQITGTASCTGSKSIALANNSSNPQGTKDAFITEGYDLSNINNTTLNFKLAFANNNNSADLLKVYCSSNCGQTWTLRYFKNGANLATTASVSGNFIPNASDWRLETVPIAGYHGVSNLRIKFEFTNDGGNNIYIDDININGIPLSVSELNAQSLRVKLQPNPAQSQTAFTYTLDKTDDVKIELYDMIGKRISTIENSRQLPGEHHILIQRPSQGMFLLQMRAGNKVMAEKIIFE